MLSDLFHIFSEGNQICMKAMNTLLDYAAQTKFNSSQVQFTLKKTGQIDSYSLKLIAV